MPGFRRRTYQRPQRRRPTSSSTVCVLLLSILLSDSRRKLLYYCCITTTYLVLFVRRWLWAKACWHTCLNSEQLYGAIRVSHRKSLAIRAPGYARERAVAHIFQGQRKATLPAHGPAESKEAGASVVESTVTEFEPYAARVPPHGVRVYPRTTITIADRIFVRDLRCRSRSTAACGPQFDVERHRQQKSKPLVIA